MAVPLLDLKAQHGTIRDQVLAAIMPIIDGQTFILGEPVERLEGLVAKLSNAAHAIGCANGTDAILLALRALDVGRNDAVVTTPFTFFATAGAVHNVGARPVFADIDPDTFNISVEAVDEAVRNTPDVKAVIAVDLFGQMAAIDGLRSVLPDGMPIIEDAAQSIGASREVNGKKVMAGEIADIGTFSFFPSKNLGGYGDGGMVVTQSDELDARLRRLRTHGSVKTYFHEEVGYNSRLDTLQAVVLEAKLPHLEAWSAARRRNASLYDNAFADLDGVRTPAIDPRNESIYNQYTLRAERRDELQAFLKQRSIGNSIYYPLPLHMQPCFAYLGYEEGDFPQSERAAKEVVSLPVYPELTDSQRDEVISSVRAFYGR
ncbi:MAG: DegT/DnrJ/EryC1/StrS family aminotransferase [Gemmatimonadaceae bacterium]